MWAQSRPGEAIRVKPLSQWARGPTDILRPNATVQVCYTFTAVSYPSDAAHPRYAPAASEADFDLRKTANWYLNAITNDHVVPGCGATK
jgi:hypothetical protein